MVLTESVAQGEPVGEPWLLGRHSRNVYVIIIHPVIRDQLSEDSSHLKDKLCSYTFLPVLGGLQCQSLS